jgi:hypothetical protein
MKEVDFVLIQAFLFRALVSPEISQGTEHRKPFHSIRLTVEALPDVD